MGRRRWRRLCVRLVLLSVGAGLVLAALLQMALQQHDNSNYSSRYLLPVTAGVAEVEVGGEEAAPRDAACGHHSCFSVYACDHAAARLTVHVYPPVHLHNSAAAASGLQTVQLPLSREFQQLVQAVVDSDFYTSDPDAACLFLPQLDLLNQNLVNASLASRVLKQLSRWGEGENHLLFNMLPGQAPDYSPVLQLNTHKALIAGGGFDVASFRSAYDISIPVYNPHTAAQPRSQRTYSSAAQRWLLVVSQLSSRHAATLRALATRSGGRVLLLQPCSPAHTNATDLAARCDTHGRPVAYPHVLEESAFCTVVRSARLGQAALYDVMKFGCVPVLVADEYVPPFSEVIDWTRAAVRVAEEHLPDVTAILERIPDAHVQHMRRQVLFLFDNYFHSMAAITMTTLQIINDRVFPYAARKHEDWNGPLQDLLPVAPLFLRLQPPAQQGFTAVILAYDRLESLFRVITNVAACPSLAKVLVVWNNQLKQPPPSSKWPKISKPLKIVKTTHNKLSNRFYPYEEVETEAVLALDDDIVMLSASELEFAYRVWREAPDRLVGFPSRLHEWDNSTRAWRYESEWKSSVSIVLTGAAFYHKYYSYLYTNALPGDIKAWVDEHFNCEDLAMNFLIANVTGKAPIKVSPRQKFKCLREGCQGETFLSADSLHMVERNDCLEKFARLYGAMPLRAVEFRADPVLYKEALPAALRQYPDMGSL